MYFSEQEEEEEEVQGYQTTASYESSHSGEEKL